MMHEDFELTISSRDSNRLSVNASLHLHFVYRLDTPINLNPHLNWHASIKLLQIDGRNLSEKVISLSIPEIECFRALDYVNLNQEENVTTFAPKWLRSFPLEKHYFSTIEVKIGDYNLRPLKLKGRTKLNGCVQPTILTIAFKIMHDDMRNFHFSSNQNSEVFPTNRLNDFIIDLPKTYYFESDENFKLALIQISLPSQPKLDETHSIRVYQQDEADINLQFVKLMYIIPFNFDSISTGKELVQALNNVLDRKPGEKDGYVKLSYEDVQNKIKISIKNRVVHFSPTLREVMGIVIEELSYKHDNRIFPHPINLKLLRPESLMLHCESVCDSQGGKKLCLVSPINQKNLYYESTHPNFVPIDVGILDQLRFRITTVDNRSIKFDNENDKPVLLSIQLKRFPMK